MKRGTTSLRTRLTAVVVLVVILVLATFGLVVRATLSRYLTGEVDTQLRLIHSTLGPRLGDPRRISQIDGPVNMPIPPPARNVDGIAGGSYAAMADPQGVVLASWDLNTGEQIENAPSRLDADLVRRVSETSTPAIATRGGSRILVSALGSPQRGRLGYSLVAMPLHSVDATLARLDRILIIGGAVAAVTAAALGTWLVSVGLRPLARVTHAARRVSTGERGIRVGRHDPNTEVGALAESFDTMLEELESAVARSEASEAAIRRFVADAAHELRTPLASVRGHAEVLRRGMAAPESTADVALRVEDGALRLGTLIEQMITLARLDASAPLALDEVDLTAIVAEGIVDADARHPDHTFTLDALNSPAIVSADRVQVRQAVDNLLSNAGRHTPPGTSVRITVERQGDGVAITVADDGPGFGDLTSEAAFDRFARADASRTRDTGGSGLGLSIVRGIAVAHGGRADASPSKVGVSVRLWLPMGRPAAAAES